jgi:hypothetical protein
MKLIAVLIASVALIRVVQLGDGAALRVRMRVQVPGNRAPHSQAVQLPVSLCFQAFR